MKAFKRVWQCYLVSVVTSVYVYCSSGTDEKRPRIFSLHVLSDIKFHFATTLVTSRVLNPSDVAREAVFDVTLPNQAFISNFTLEIEGKVYPGIVKEKEAAQKQYDAAKKKGQSAGQVSQRPRETNNFKVEVNVGAQQKVTFNLTYQEVLERRLGVYDHVIYIDPGQPVEDMHIEVSIEENREITYLHVPPIRNDLLTDVDLTDAFQFDREKLMNLLKEEQDQLHILLEKYRDKLLEIGAHGKVRAVATKHVGHALVRVQEEEDAQFIVMGGRGKGTLRRTFMGSVSDYVVHHASVPVLVCRNRTHLQNRRVNKTTPSN